MEGASFRDSFGDTASALALTFHVDIIHVNMIKVKSSNVYGNIVKL